MLTKISAFVKSHFYDIMLFVIVALLISLSFATGFIIAKYQSKTPLEITNTK